MKENQFTPLPKNINGKIDLIQLKQLYMTSEHFEWASFCRAFKFDPSANKRFPLKVWQKEKKDRLIALSSGKIEDLFAVGMHSWKTETLKNLHYYPAIIDSLFSVVANKVESFKKKSEIDLGLTDQNELLTLAKTLKALTDAKYRSLLIDKLNFSQLKELLKTQEQTLTEDDNKWIIDHLGSESISGSDVTKLMAKWYDPSCIKIN